MLMEPFYVQKTPFYQRLWFPVINQLPLLARCHPWTITSLSYSLLASSIAVSLPSEGFSILSHKSQQELC